MKHETKAVPNISYSEIESKSQHSHYNNQLLPVLFRISAIQKLKANHNAWF